MKALARRIAGDDSAVRDVWLVHGLGSTASLTFEGSGWVRALTPLVEDPQRPARLWFVELPGHADYAAALEDPASVSADAGWVGDGVARLIEEHSAPLAGSGEDWTRAVIGYSFGGRLAWECASAVNRVIIGGLPLTDPDHETRASVLAAAGQDPAENPQLAELLDAVTANPFTGAEPPTVPTLIAYGEKDEIAATAPELAALAPHAVELVIPGRHHMNAVSARVFKSAALELLGESA